MAGLAPRRCWTASAARLARARADATGFIWASRRVSARTYTALEELLRRKERGTDVVIGFLETHGRRKTAELAAPLEMVPRKQIPYKGVIVEELDTDAVIRRHPAVALVDELAHTNALAPSTRSAGRMSKICSRPASPSSARSTSSTSRVSRTSSKTLPASRCGSACRTA